MLVSALVALSYPLQLHPARACATSLIRAGCRSAAPKREKDVKLAQKLGQLQPFIAVFPQECMGQLPSLWAKIRSFSLQAEALAGVVGSCYAQDRKPGATLSL